MHSTTLHLLVWLGVYVLMPTTRVAAGDLCRKCADPHRFEYPGVGFDLTFDYG